MEEKIPILEAMVGKYSAEFMESGKELISRYQEYLGIINQNIGKMADEVVEVVYGIPIWYKGGKIIENAVE